MRSSGEEVGRTESKARSRVVHCLVALGFALTLGAVTGCSINKNTGEEMEAVPATYLRVENRAFLDMTVYVYRSSQRVRIGVATGNSTTKLRIPGDMIFGATPLRFQADPIGGSRRSISQEITVTAGDEVILTIPAS